MILFWCLKETCKDASAFAYVELLIRRLSLTTDQPEFLQYLSPDPSSDFLLNSLPSPSPSFNSYSPPSSSSSSDEVSPSSSPSQFGSSSPPHLSFQHNNDYNNNNIPSEPNETKQYIFLLQQQVLQLQHQIQHINQHMNIPQINNINNDLNNNNITINNHSHPQIEQLNELQQIQEFLQQPLETNIQEFEEVQSIIENQNFDSFLDDSLSSPSLSSSSIPNLLFSTNF